VSPTDDASSAATKALQAKYAWTAWWYDLLDYPWERQYRRWRPALVEDVRGTVLEVGVGTGRNLEYYSASVNLIGVELSRAMLNKAVRRSMRARCAVSLVQEDATVMASIPSAHFDWIFSTFLCCVMADELQPLAIGQFERVLKPGGKFRLLEMVFSKNRKLRRRQEWFAPFVEKVYGARFDRRTLEHLRRSPGLEVQNTYFLKDDVYMVIEGERRK
jgi:ubiquinone/menaquinone biosynthesis C-methylase UbiE